MRISNISNPIGFISLGIFPPIAGAYLGATSMAMGLLISVILIFLLNIKYYKNLCKLDVLTLKILLLFLLYSFFQHFLISFWTLKSYISFFLLLFIFIFSFFFSKIISYENAFSNNNVYSVNIFCLLLAVITYLSDFEIGVFFYNHHKAVFPFGEVSHFALFYGPFFILLLVIIKKSLNKFFLLAFFSFIALSLQSTSLAIYFFLSLLLFIRFTIKGTFIVIPIFLIGIYIITTNEYFSSRLVVDASSTNLTSLVYLQGIQDAYNSFINTYGLGLGFQMLGTQPPSEVFYQILRVLGQDTGGTGVNRFDGGFLAAKLIAELGVLGIAFLGFYLFLLIKSFIYIQAFLRGDKDYSNEVLFSLTFIYSASVEFFIRGVGYFSPSLFLFFVALFSYRRLQDQNAL